MPTHALSRNIRKERTQRRKTTWLYLSGVTDPLVQTPLSMSASVGYSLNGGSVVYTELTQDEQAMGMFDGDSGREMKVSFDVTGYIEMSTAVEEPASLFTMIKRVSPVMPDPTIDSDGKPT